MSDVTVHWSDRALKPAPALSEERLAAVQEQLGVAFPEDYLTVVGTHQGAAPDRTLVTLPDGTGTTLSMLLHFEDHPEGLDLLGILEFSEILPKRVIPFALDPGGNYFCFDYRSTGTDPPVVFLATDDPEAEPERLASSFTELIDSLQKG